MNFKPIEPNDCAIIRSYTMPSSINICDMAFSNLYGWSGLYKTSWAVVADSLVIRFESPQRAHPAYLCPIPPTDCQITEAVKILEEVCHQEGYPLTIMGITPCCKEALETARPGDFVYLNDRDYCDYIYEREALCTLAGKKLQSKRNHANRFEREHPDYEYIEIGPDLVEDCHKLERAWLLEHGNEEGESDEKNMIRRVMTNMEALGVKGGAIRIDGRVVAFTIGGPINHQTYGIHIEKADTSIDGAFAIINREFARRIPNTYTYINREEDLGIEGLRKSKLSYKPAFLLCKEVAILRHDQA